MDKRGAVKRLLFEISFIVFAVAVSLSVLYFVFIATNDTSLQTKLYQEDLEQVIHQMNIAKANNLKVKYDLPEIFKIEQKNSKFFISDGEVELEIKYEKEEDSEIKAIRDKNILNLEKNEKLPE
jgi:pyruvate kinase